MSYVDNFEIIKSLICHYENPCVVHPRLTSLTVTSGELTCKNVKMRRAKTTLRHNEKASNRVIETFINHAGNSQCEPSMIPAMLKS